MKTFITILLGLLAAVFGVLGKFGTLVAVIAWVLGLIGLINTVSFWWIPTGILCYIVALFLGATAALTASKL
jgi:hypothetical protein